MTWNKTTEELRKEESEIYSTYRNNLHIRWLHMSISDRSKLVKIADRLFPKKDKENENKRNDTENI